MGVVRELLRPWYLKWFYFRAWPSRRPAGFRDAWSFPEARGGGADFVFLPMADWHGPVQRTQQLALALARRGHRCLYANPHLGREFPQPFAFSRGTAVREVAPAVSELHVHLPLEPVFHHRTLSERENERLASAIGPLLARGAVVISSFPLWTAVAERLRRSHDAVVVYDCHDLIEGFGNVAHELVGMETEAIEGADVAVFSSEPLAERWRRAGSVVIRNAGEPEHFRLVPWGGRSATPAIGYVGALNHWFDSEAVAFAAESRPNWKFVLIGHIDTVDLRRLRLLPNVRLAGPAPYAELPQRMQEFDVALIPFTLSPLIEAVNPGKLYEYLASGLPVVSSRLPEVATFRGHVYTYGSADEMVNAIETALAEDSQARREARRARVLGDTWDARAQELQAAISAARDRTRACSRH
jgi:glycosyltransferase involved in cell wall biosynthesis